MYRVVLIYEPVEHRTRPAVVKTDEYDPDLWGVVAFYGTTYEAKRECERMRTEQVRLQLATAELWRRSQDSA